MAPGQPIPSSAALKALRGLVFTTGCSVVLLAEERRRRVNIARSAVENARKLRNAKTKLRQSDISPRRIESSNHLQSTVPRRRRRPRTSPNSSSAIETLSVDSNLNVPIALVDKPHHRNLSPTPRLHAGLEAISIAWSFQGQSVLRYEGPALWGTRMMRSTSKPIHHRYFTTTRPRHQVPAVTSTPHHKVESTIQSPTELSTSRQWPTSELFHASGMMPLQSFDYEAHLSNNDVGLLVRDEIRRVKSRVQKIKNPKDADRIRYTELNRFADRMMATRSPMDLDATLRYFANSEGLKINGEWFHKIFDFYTRNPDPRPMLSWLPFCLEQKFCLRPQEMARFYNRCRQHWGFTDEDVDKVYASLAAISDAVPAPSTISIQPKETWKDAYVRNSRKLLSRNEWKSCPDAGIFFIMEKAAQDGDWELVWKTFQNSQSETDLSAPCFRLAVLARIELDRGWTVAAKNLVWSRASLHDVSTAVTPLLMAQLEEGADPRFLITDTLQRGVTIPDMVYNVAAKRALDAEGSAQDAIDICYDAARNNGRNNLLYSIYNVRNLAWGFTRLSNYRALEELLDAFMSQPKPPPSNHTRMCRESFKHIMKFLARRAIGARTTGSSAEHIRVLNKVNEAVVHCGGVSQALDANLRRLPQTDDQALGHEGIAAQGETRHILGLSKELARTPAAAKAATTTTSGIQNRSKGLLTAASTRPTRRPGSANVGDEFWNTQSLSGKMEVIAAQWKQINVLLASLKKETQQITHQSRATGLQQGSHLNHGRRTSKKLVDRSRGRSRTKMPARSDKGNLDGVHLAPHTEKAVSNG